MAVNENMRRPVFGGPDDGRPNPRGGGRGQGGGKHHRPPRTARGDQGRGVMVSIGPTTKKTRFLRRWLTFPLTPQAIPVSVSGLWSDFQVVGEGEYSNFSGSALDTISFSGVLEPPAYYTAIRKRPGDIAPEEFGEWDGGRNRERLQDVKTSPKKDENLFPIIPRGGQDFEWVVMESGAHAGPSVYLEPHAFVEIITRCIENGEIIKLIVGDDVGWQGRVSIRDFTWSYEDPDPDVLYYDITFREHRARAVEAAVHVPRHKFIKTKNNDTLRKIAVREFGKDKRWKDILRLNDKVIADLFLVPDENKVYEKRRANKHQHKVGNRGAKPENFDPDIRFDAKIGLWMDKGAKKDAKKQRKKNNDGNGKGDGDKPDKGGGDFSH